MFRTARWTESSCPFLKGATSVLMRGFDAEWVAADLASPQNPVCGGAPGPGTLIRASTRSAVGKVIKGCLRSQYDATS